MEKEAVLRLLDELLEVPAGTLTGFENPRDWDSIMIICVMALADEHFNKQLAGPQISQANTVNEVVDLLIG